MPIKVLSLLTGMVILAHLLVILGATNSLQATQRPARDDARPFSTRSIALAPAQPPSPATAPATSPSTPTPRATRTIAKAAPAPRPSEATPTPATSVNADITRIGPSGSVAAGPVLESTGEPVAAASGNTVMVGPAATVALSPRNGLASGSASDVAASAVAPMASATAPDSTATQPSPNLSNLPAQPAKSASNLSTAGAATAYTFPGSTRLQYNVIATKGSLNFNARAELLWLQNGSTYDARLEVSAFLLGSRVQTSTGQMTASGLEPKRFADKFRSEVAAHFERDRRLVTFSANTPQVALLTGMQDQLSVVMQLGAMVAGAPAQFPSGTEITFDTIGPRSSDKWVMTVGQEETLALPGGELLTLKLTRKPRGEFDQMLELWLAPQLAYLPARIKLTEKNGDYADQLWRASAPP